MPAAAAAIEIMPAENRLLERRRTLLRDETRPSAPATNTAGNVPYQQAIKKTNASDKVKVILSRLMPFGSVNVFGNRLIKMISGTKPSKISCCRGGCRVKRKATEASHVARPAAVTKV